MDSSDSDNSTDRLPSIDTYPDNIPTHAKARDNWLVWGYEGNGAKRALGPWERGGELKPIKGYKEKTVGFDEAVKWTEMTPYHVSRISHRGWGNTVGLFYLLPVTATEESMVFVDLDDVRDPDTETLHPDAIELIARAGSYAQVSTSGTGVHILLSGSFNDGTETITTDMEPTDVFPNPEIEVYTKDRLIAMTGDQIEGTSDTIERDDAFLDYLSEEYGTPSTVHDVHTESVDPEVTKQQLQSVDSTTNIQDQFDAVAHIKPSHISLNSTVTNSREGCKDMDPSWEVSESGTRLAQLEDGWVYRKGMVGLDAAQVVALEEGILRRVGEYPSGSEWFDTVEALRERGAHIPELDKTELFFSNAAILPGLEGRDDTPAISRSDLQDRTFEAMQEAIVGGEDVVVDAIMTAGKSYGAFKAIKSMGEKASVFVARNDMKAQAREYARQVGIPADDILVLPSITRHCPTWDGAFGDEWESTIKAQYHAGATPKAIHAMNDGIPCHGPDGDGQCPYETRWDFEPDDYQVLIGHYKHSHVTHVSAGRVAVFDESPTSQFTTRLAGSRLVTAVNEFLSSAVSPPVAGFEELLSNRNDQQTVQACMRWFNQMESIGEIDLGSPDSETVVNEVDGADTTAYHAYAPHAVYTILESSPVADDANFERCFLPDQIGGGLFFSTSDQRGQFYVELQESPEMHYASSVLALDGTPLIDDDRPDPHKPREWTLALGQPLSHRRILSDEERREYIRDTLQHKYISASDFIEPYSSGRYNDLAEDAALCQAMKVMYGGGTDAPLAFTPKAVADQYAAAGLVENGVMSGLDYPGNLRGSDRYASERLLAILGSTHHGDHEIRRRAAWLQTGVSVSGRGRERDYGSDIANSILEQMRELTTAQLAMRVGRDGDGATIVLKTTAFPDYLPVAGEGGVMKWSDGMQEVKDAWDDLCGGEAQFVTSTDVAEHESVTVTHRQVRNALQRFVDVGYVKKGRHPTDGRKHAYTDDGLARVSEYGQAETDLPEIDWSDSPVEETPETVRISLFTSNFRGSGVVRGGSGGAPSSGGAQAGEAATSDGEPPS